MYMQSIVLYYVLFIILQEIVYNKRDSAIYEKLILF